jgi:two-component system chemotaxis response regulator CheY
MSPPEQTSASGPKLSLRILYADDMAELRDVVRLVVERDGHVIKCVEDGEKALGVLSANPAAFDLLITDHHMPLLDGLGLVEALRALRFPGRIMVFSSALNREVHDRYRQFGVDRVLYKPVPPADLRRAIREIFAGYSGLPKDREAAR